MLEMSDLMYVFVQRFCKKTYPGIRVTNIVEGNENVTICSGEDCKSSYSVVPYRCLGKLITELKAPLSLYRFLRVLVEYFSVV